MGERCLRKAEAGGSIPPISTTFLDSVVLDGELAVPCTRNPLQRG